MFGFDQNKENNFWKEKALGRNKVIKDLNKKINELEKSRNKWKEKADIFKKKSINLSIELKKNNQ